MRRCGRLAGHRLASCRFAAHRPAKSSFGLRCVLSSLRPHCSSAARSFKIAGKSQGRRAPRWPSNQRETKPPLLTLTLLGSSVLMEGLLRASALKKRRVLGSIVASPMPAADAPRSCVRSHWAGGSVARLERPSGMALETATPKARPCAPARVMRSVGFTEGRHFLPILTNTRTFPRVARPHSRPIRAPRATHRRPACAPRCARNAGKGQACKRVRWERVEQPSPCTPISNSLETQKDGGRRRQSHRRAPRLSDYGMTGDSYPYATYRRSTTGAGLSGLTPFATASQATGNRLQPSPESELVR